MKDPLDKDTVDMFASTKQEIALALLSVLLPDELSELDSEDEARLARWEEE